MSYHPDYQPPSYDEVMSESSPPGHLPEVHEYNPTNPLCPPPIAGPQTADAASSSVNQAAPPLEQLSFVDFLPRCTRGGDKKQRIKPLFDSYRVTCSFLNDWLTKNLGYSVLSIEQVERPVNWDGSYPLDSTYLCRSGGGENMYLRGLRVWLRPRRSEEGDAPQQVGYFNFLPTKQTGNQSGLAVLTGRKKYNNLDKTLEYLNAQLKTNPIPGRVISVQTLTIHTNDITSNDGAFTQDKTDESFYSVPGFACEFFTFLRVYFIRGNPKPVEFGIRDFVPEPLTKGQLTLQQIPKFEPLDVIHKKAQQWIRDHDGRELHLINMQTLTLHTDSPTNMNNLGLNTREMVYDIPSNKVLGVKRLDVRFLRACYVRPLVPEPRPPLAMTVQTVAPILLAHKVSENVGQTVQRINAWLKETGACIYGVETIEERCSQYTSRCDMECTANTIQGTGVCHYITAIRLYLDGAYTDFTTLKGMGRPISTEPVKEEKSRCAIQ